MSHTPINIIPDTPTLKERYTLLIAARNFHYDNFSKWASYFYVAIGALFVAYYSIASAEKINEDKRKILELIILVLGYLFSLLWFLSNKGYYFWNLNYIKLVHQYEIDTFGWKDNNIVYSALATKDGSHSLLSMHPLRGANISTSKIAIFFAYLVTLTWSVLLVLELFPVVSNNTWYNVVIYAVSSVGITMLLSWMLGAMLASNIKHMRDLGIDFSKSRTKPAENDKKAHLANNPEEAGTNVNSTNEKPK